MKYRKKPIVIDAIRWYGDNLHEVKEFVGKALEYEILDSAWIVGKGIPHTIVHINTLEGKMEVSIGDYIIKGICGEFYPCKEGIFEQTYEKVEE